MLKIYSSSVLNLGAPPKPAAALLSVSAKASGRHGLMPLARRVRAASRFGATSSPAWRKNQNSNQLSEIRLQLFRH
jgi:hypothetical protein